MAENYKMTPQERDEFLRPELGQAYGIVTGQVEPPTEPADGMDFGGQAGAPAPESETDKLSRRLEGQYNKLSGEIDRAGRRAKRAEDDILKADEDYRKAIAPALQQADEENNKYKEIVQKRVESRAKLLENMANLDNMANQLAATPMHDRWAEASTPLKIGALLATALGAAVQTFYGDKTNIVADQINAAIEKDLRFQQLAIQRGEKAFANKRLLLKDTLEMFDDEDLAFKAAHLAALESAKSRLDVLANNSSNPKVVAEVARAKAAIDMHTADKKAALQEQQIGEQYRMAMAESTARTNTERAGLKAQELEYKRQDLARKQADSDRRQNAVQIPGTKGVFKGGPADAEKIRNATATVSTMNRLYDEMDQALRQGIGLSNKFEWDQLKAVLGNIAKEKDVFNFGAALSKEEASRLDKAIGARDVNYVMRGEGRKLLHKARMRFNQQLADKYHTHGLKVGPNHLFLAEEADDE